MLGSGRDGLVERLARFLEQRSEVLEAYLFCSRARGRAQPRSDVDVAVFVDESRLPPAPFGYAAELATGLISLLNDNRVDVVMIDCVAVPENFSLEFTKTKPSHIVFFDAVDMGKEPGSYALIREGALATCSMSTHKQSVKVLFRVLREGLPGVRSALIGAAAEDNGIRERPKQASWQGIEFDDGRSGKSHREEPL